LYHPASPKAIDMFLAERFGPIGLACHSTDTIRHRGEFLPAGAGIPSQARVGACLRGPSWWLSNWGRATAASCAEHWAAQGSHRVGGERHEFYILELSLGGRVFLPTANAELSGVRRLMSRPEALDLAKVVMEEPELDDASRRERNAGCADALRGGAAGGYTETLRQLLLRSRSSKLTLTERRLLDTARTHFVGEVSLVLRWPVETLEAMLPSVTEPQS